MGTIYRATEGWSPSIHTLVVDKGRIHGAELPSSDARLFAVTVIALVVYLSQGVYHASEAQYAVTAVYIPG